MAVTMGRQTSDQLSSEFSGSGGSGSAFFSTGALSSALASPQDVNVVTKTWSTNPFLGSDTMSGVVSVDVHLSEDSSVVNVTSADTPIVLTLSAPGDSEPSTLRCTYYNRHAAEWDASGTALVGVELDSTNGVILVSCATMHLSDFSGKVAPPALNLFLPNPLTSGSMLASAFDAKSLVVSIVIISIFGACLIAWAFSGAIDRRKAESLQALRRAHILLYGEVAPGFGRDLVHEADSASGRRKAQELYDKMRVRVFVCVPPNHVVTVHAIIPYC